MYACVRVCMCMSVCLEMCVLVCVTRAWLHACAIYTTCTTSMSLVMHLCILGLVRVNKHIWVPVSLVFVCVCFFLHEPFSLSLGDCFTRQLLDLSHQRRMTDSAPPKQRCSREHEQIKSSLNFSFSPQCLPPPFLPTQSNGIAWWWDKISIAPTQILLHLLMCLPAAHRRISIVCESKHYNEITLILIWRAMF